MVFYYCPSLESVKELLAMAIQQVCPCADDVVDTAWRQWIQLIFKSQDEKNAYSRPTSPTVSVTSMDTVVRIHPGR